MAQIPTVPPLEGVDDLYSLLAFLVDPEAVEKRLASMEKVRDEINGMIEKVGKASDIDRLSIQASTDREMARRELAQARDTIKVEQAAATAERDKLEAMYAKEREQGDRAYNARMAGLEQKDRALKDREQQVSEYDLAVSDKARAAEAKWNEATAMRDEYNRKLAKLKAAGVI